VKLHDPDLWVKIVEDVACRRHEIQGGSGCEADGRIPSGEAWVRQRLYGQLFYARNFSRLANVAWFPDSFGYASNLPQIFAKSGASGFFTAKLVPNKETKWPLWAWRWEAPDGSSLVSYLTGSQNKLGPFGNFHKKQPDSPVPESYIKSYSLLKPGAKTIFDYEVNEPENHSDISDDELPFIGVFSAKVMVVMARKVLMWLFAGVWWKGVWQDGATPRNFTSFLKGGENYCRFGKMSFIMNSIGEA